jgi:hypothetical protein
MKALNLINPLLFTSLQLAGIPAAASFSDLAPSHTATSTVVLDERRVYNPNPNETLKSFDGIITSTSPHRNEYVEMAGELEQVVLDWIETNEEGEYLRYFDKENFHWQFINDGKGERIGHFGVVLIVPEKEIRPSFYEELGGGLMLSGKHLTDFNVHWTNDGEMFSFVINKSGLYVQNFKNWRFAYQAVPEYDKVYYSNLVVYLNTRGDYEKLNVKHFVGASLKESLEIESGDTLELPKGCLSTLVICDKSDNVKGIICFNMKSIADMCPMPFATTVSLKLDEISADKVLYAEPQCSDIYSFSFLESDSFEDISEIYTWIESNFFSEIR